MVQIKDLQKHLLFIEGIKGVMGEIADVDHCYMVVNGNYILVDLTIQDLYEILDSVQIITDQIYRTVVSKVIKRQIVNFVTLVHYIVVLGFLVVNPAVVATMKDYIVYSSVKVDLVNR